MGHFFGMAQGYSKGHSPVAAPCPEFSGRRGGNAPNYSQIQPRSGLNPGLAEPQPPCASAFFFFLGVFFFFSLLFK